MKAEILSVGTELLLGEIVDTNAAFLATELAQLGIDLHFVSQVGDNRGRLAETIGRAFERADLVIITGGVGPTEDDTTREAISDVLGEEMAVHPDLAETLREMFRKFGREMPPSNIKQASLIPSARTLPNPIGTAPGWWVEREGHVIVAMPGVPHEMKRMWEEQAMPRLQKSAGTQVIATRTLKTIGLGESHAEQEVLPLIHSINPTLATYAKPDGVHLRMAAKAADRETAQRMLADFEVQVRELVGDYIYGVDNETPSAAVGKLLRERGLTVATMESASGGLLASMITDTAGSSAYFMGGIIAYNAEQKIKAGVDAAIIERVGTVDPETVLAMARAARERIGADIGLATTGVAGPEPLEGKPVGTLIVALDYNGKTLTDRREMSTTRVEFKRRAAMDALFLAWKALREGVMSGRHYPDRPGIFVAGSTSKDDWLESTYRRAVQRSPERQATFETTAQVPIAPLYASEDLAGCDEHEKLGYPGEYPFTRGVQPTMYRGRLWTMRQYAGYATAVESNRRYRYLLEHGQTGLSVAFDLPTQMGYDSDHPMAEGEVGKVGVAICSVEDMERLLADIPLDKVSTSMTINATAAILLAMYVAVGKRQGADPRTLNGTIQNDILKEYIARGTYIYPPRPSLRIVTDVFRYCTAEVPSWNTISISGYHIREAGATAVQEIAFTLADAIEYVQAALDSGLEVDAFAPRLAFFFDSHNNLLEEVAKFRAARRMWASIMRDRFQARDPRSWMLRFHTQTAGVSLTAQQVYNNVTRVTVQALAAVLGGTQSLHCNAWDEALALPTELAARTALRTQQILAYESGVADTADPLAGSYYVEWLTDELERRAWDYLGRIDEQGGALRAIESGFIQREIQESAYRYQRELERGDRVIVGVNRFQVDERDVKQEILTVDPSVRDEQSRRLAELRARRDNGQVATLLQRLEDAARGPDNLMPHILACVEGLCTLGEISDALRRVFGEERSLLAL